jgi:hypothetical protein
MEASIFTKQLLSNWDDLRRFLKQLHLSGEDPPRSSGWLMGLGPVEFDLLKLKASHFFQGCWFAVFLNMLVKGMVDKRQLTFVMETPGRSSRVFRVF